MLDFEKKIAIYGTGGLSKDIYYCLKDIYSAHKFSIEGKIIFVDKKLNHNNVFLNCPLLLEEEFDSATYQVILAIGNPFIRKSIVAKLPKNTLFPTIIHPTVLLNESASLGKGIVILPFTVISCDVSIGDFCIVDRGVQIGHDCLLGDFNHLAPLAVLSGNVTLESLVEIGTTAALKQNISISSETIVGMAAVVVNSISEKGVYVGNPAKKIK